MKENVPRFGAIYGDERKSRIKGVIPQVDSRRPLLPAVRTVLVDTLRVSLTPTKCT
jgi:hypothetical protein